jgi:hypothetical protein
MPDTFTDKTEWVTTTRPLPEGWSRTVSNVAEYVLGHDLRLCVQQVRVVEPSPKGTVYTVKGDGWTVEAFDSDGNHLCTVATTTAWYALDLDRMITTVLSWPWTRDFVTPSTDDSIGYRHFPFTGL